MGDLIKQFNQTYDQLADVYVIDDYQIERLRKILEKQHGRKITFDEAKKTGNDLVELYKALAGKRKLVKGGLTHKDRLGT